MSFVIELEQTTPLLTRFHRTLMDRRQELPFDQFEVGAYDAEIVEHARHQWAGRAVAEYMSTAQFAQLIHRLTLVGAPLELIGAASRLVTDECRHAELCAQMADVLGGRQGHEVTRRGLSLFEEEDDPWLTIALTVLEVCCFGESLSIPMLESISLASSDPLPQAIAKIISTDEEYHARYGWEVLSWLCPKLNDTQRLQIQTRLPSIMAHFEHILGASREVLDQLAGQDVDIEPGDDDLPNLGTLSLLQYAAIFYHTMQERILPSLEELGFDAYLAWGQRPDLASSKA